MTSMTAHGRVSEYLDGALAGNEEAAVLDHVAGCAECQAELHAEVQLRDREEALRGVTESAACLCEGQAGDYLDGTLDAEAETVFLDHIATCAQCQRELHVEVQLRDREDELRDRRDSAHAPPTRRTVAARRALWRRVGPGAVVSLTLTAAAGLALFVTRPPHSANGSRALALNPTRAIEIRLSHPLAAGHRPYDTMRGSASLGEAISPTVIAELDVAGDCQGVAAAYVLANELVRADERYRRCGGAPVDADRAGLALLRGQPDLAIELTERVLDAAPDNTVALWNRALALRTLGLELSAAAAFERVAALEQTRDSGWAREASERAAALRDIERVRIAYNEVVRLGAEMVQGGAPLPAALALEVPARSRVMLHDAIRTATTPARIDELVPLATALGDRLGTDLRRYLVHARARLSPQREAASAEYKKIVERNGDIDDDAWASFFSLATRARADDLMLGARILTDRLDGNPSAEQLAAAIGDPWFERAVELSRANQALEAGRIEKGAERLLTIQRHCGAGATSYRCLQLSVALADLALARHQPTEALKHALAALPLARQLGEWPQHGQALRHAGDAQRLGGNFALASVYYEESGRSQGDCGRHNAAFTTAEMRFQHHELALARELVASAPACDEPASPVELTMLVRLLRTGHATRDRASVLREIAKARAAPSQARYVAFLDYLVELVALDDDPEARERLARIAEGASTIEGSLRDKTTVAVNMALFADAGRRTQWSEAIAVVARAFGVETPARCALAFGADDFRFVTAAVGPDGKYVGRYEADLARTAEWLAPEPIRRELVGCDEIAVLALPPWLGIGPVLDQTPWHYVLGPARSPVEGRRREVVIANPVTPPSAGLAPLAPRMGSGSSGGPDELVTGAAATPERVLAAISDATLVEIHSHATWLDRLDAPVLALSPGHDGWTLGAAKIRAAKLTGAPVVVLADCGGGAVAPFEHEAWGLPLAFRTAGARAVIASLVEIPDREAAVFFDAVTAAVAQGSSPAAAVALIRAEKIRADPTSWMRNVVVFQ